MADTRRIYYTRKNIICAVLVALGVFLFAGSISANTSSEREADRERFRDAIEERRDALNGRVNGVFKDRAGGEEKASAEADTSSFERIRDRIRENRDEFNRRIFERRNILAGGIGVERAQHSDGFFLWVLEKFKIAFLHRTL